MKRERSPVIETIRNVMPSVVSILITKHRKDVEAELTAALQAETKGNKKHPVSPIEIPADKIDAHGMVQVGGGSGFVVEDSGIILTNKHVIAEPNANYTVITNDNREYIAEVLARDPIDDVAILKITSDKKFPVVPLGDSNHLELGQTVLAIGNALGLFKNTVSMGIVSGLSRAVSAQSDPGSPSQEMRGLIQTDAAINPGNSGGPLVDIFGQAIGINAAVVFGAQNINFAIPINAAYRDLHDLKKYGRIRRPLLGLRYLTITPFLKEKKKLPIEYGALVTKEHSFETAIVPGSPSAQAGIEENDILIGWEGGKITSEKTIQDYLEQSEVGETISLTLLRNGEIKKVSVTLTERK